VNNFDKLVAVKEVVSILLNYPLLVSVSIMLTTGGGISVVSRIYRAAYRKFPASRVRGLSPILSLSNDKTSYACSRVHANVNLRTISQELFSRWFSADTEDKVGDLDDENDCVDEVASTLIEPNTKSHSRKVLDNLPITFADISRAEVAIRGGVKRTTCERSHFISELVGANVFFKNEFRQFTGSFKERGARNAILKLIRDKGSSLRGVIAASAGNHALALAYHGQLLGIPATVVMPTTAPLAKVDKCRVSADTSIHREKQSCRF
jgi:Pyridoxal-phosphate dependent enzyme